MGDITVALETERAPIDPDKGEGWMKGQLLAEPVEIVEMRRVESAAAPAE